MESDPTAWEPASGNLLPSPSNTRSPPPAMFCRVRSSSTTASLPWILAAPPSCWHSWTCTTLCCWRWVSAVAHPPTCRIYALHCPRPASQTYVPGSPPALTLPLLLLLLPPPVCLPQVLAPIQAARLILASAPHMVDAVQLCRWLCAAAAAPGDVASEAGGGSDGAGAFVWGGGSVGEAVSPRWRASGQEGEMRQDGGTVALWKETLAAADAFLQSCWAEEDSDDSEGEGSAPVLSLPGGGGGDGSARSSGSGGDAGHLLSRNTATK